MKASLITLTSAMEKRVRAARERLNSALAAHDRVMAQAEKLAEKSESLTAQIAQDERDLDPLDDDACLRLTAKRNQLAAVIKKLGELEPQLEAAEEVVARLFGEGKRVAGDAHGVELEALRADARAAVAPFFGADSNGPDEIVKQFPRIRQEWYFCGNVGMGTASIESSRRLLAMLDGLLKGDSSFVFVPE